MVFFISSCNDQKEIEKKEIENLYEQSVEAVKKLRINDIRYFAYAKSKDGSLIYLGKALPFVVNFEGSKHLMIEHTIPEGEEKRIVLLPVLLEGEHILTPTKKH